MLCQCSFACTTRSRRCRRHDVCLKMYLDISGQGVSSSVQYQMLNCYCAWTSCYFNHLLFTLISLLLLVLVPCAIDSDPLCRENLDSIPPTSEELSFGNSVYKITFESRERPMFGHKYWFFLQDAVENVPEYVVHWDNFVQ